MAKEKKDKHGNAYVSADDSLKESLRDPAFADAYMERRRVQEIALAIRSMRESAGLSQAQLARLVNMKQPAIARLETSQVGTPRFRTLEIIARALHKQLSFTFGDVDEKTPLVTIRDRKTNKVEYPQVTA